MAAASDRVNPAGLSANRVWHNAPAPKTSSKAARWPVPAQTSRIFLTGGRSMKRAVAERFKNEPARTIGAVRQARRARVPLVVVEMMVLPRTISGANSRGELPRSKFTPPVWAAPILTPSRSPASRAPGWVCRPARAAAISPTGMTRAAPWCRAVTKVEVARSTSKTTHRVSAKSSGCKRGSSAGVSRAWMIFTAGEVTGPALICNGENTGFGYGLGAQ